MPDPFDPVPAPDDAEATVPDHVEALAQAATEAEPPLGEGEVALDVRAFLPEGVELGEPEIDDDAADPEDAGAGADPGPEAADATPVAVDEAPTIDLEELDQIERDLDAVDAAIAALDAGTYGIDPQTGAPIDDAVLAEDPTFLG